MREQITKILAYFCLSLLSCSTTRNANGLQNSETRSERPIQQKSAHKDLTVYETESVNETSKAFPQVVLMPSGKDPITVDVEIARTPEERQRGLMYRKHLAPNQGMLFLFEKTDHLSFWMRNTYIPLDMVFIEPGMRVLGIVENTTPLSDKSCRVPGESQYVLEVNAGFSRAHGLKRGDKVQFIGIFF